MHRIQGNLTPPRSLGHQYQRGDVGDVLPAPQHRQFELVDNNSPNS
jgi:hypothetical protein